MFMNLILNNVSVVNQSSVTISLVTKYGFLHFWTENKTEQNLQFIHKSILENLALNEFLFVGTFVMHSENIRFETIRYLEEIAVLKHIIFSGT